MPGGPLIGNGGSRFTVLFNVIVCISCFCFLLYSLKVNKNERYKLSHKITKNVLMALFLLTGLVQT